ncbi:ParB/RepB/Spo0J family partition protein [Cognatishimia sp. MH4019]|uniref:ParB/RepB/Spo0J family partition protein n=1 Tax=Cognatishimia sp. MH4019 TaxID=2854030 RepID=UPI001CD23056|nr:ParB/RepB/Spo0J family partition protein [Cognatishimia sp. MH4019]
MTKQTKLSTEHGIVFAGIEQLYLHPLNPRQEVNEEGIATLAGSIDICGLMQNLIGLQQEDGTIGIVAGGRRMRALKLLAEQDGKAQVVASIPVRLAADEAQAEIWANAENTARIDLDPADEIRAYGRMAQSEATAEAIASAFGVTVAHVKGRLKLAGLPEAALDALKTQQINLTSAQRMTTANDPKLVFEALQLIAEGRIETTRQLDHFLHPKAVTAKDRRAVFVGIEAYQDAGGRVTSDLFSEDVFFESAEVLDEAFKAALTAHAEAVKEADGWAWVEVCADAYLGWNFVEVHKYQRVYPVAGVLNDTQSERFEALVELSDTDVLDADGKAELEVLDAILEGDFTDDQKALAGCVIHVNGEGARVVNAGFIRPEDRKAAIEAGVLEKSKHGDPEAAPRNPYSQKLRDDLDAVRLASLQNAAIEKPELLLDLLAFQLSGMAGFARVFDATFESPSNTPKSETGFAVDARLSDPKASPKSPWDVDLCKAFAAFKKKGRAYRDAELSRQLSAVLVGGSEDFTAVLEGKTGAAIRSTWTPTAENLFSRISAQMMQDIYADLLGLKPNDPQFKTFVKLKKAVKAEVLEEVFSDSERQKVLGVTKAQKARIDAWVPTYFE